MNANYSEMELVSAINQKAPEALTQLFHTFSKALILLAKELTGKESDSEIVYYAIGNVWRSEKQFTSYQDLTDFLYNQVVEGVINTVKRKPFSMPKIIKIQNEAEAQIVHAEVIRLFALDRQAPSK